MSETDSALLEDVYEAALAVVKYLPLSNDPGFATYERPWMSEADLLREKANRIEQKEEDVHRLRRALEAVGRGVEFHGAYLIEH